MPDIIQEALVMETKAILVQSELKSIDKDL